LTKLTGQVRIYVVDGKVVSQRIYPSRPKEHFEPRSFNKAVELSEAEQELIRNNSLTF